MIKNNDPKLKKLKEGEELFNDSDFEEDVESEGSEPVQKKQKPVTYKDMIRKDVLKKEEKNNWDSGNESDDSFHKNEQKAQSSKKETLFEEEKRLKSEFIKASNKPRKG